MPPESPTQTMPANNNLKNFQKLLSQCLKYGNKSVIPQNTLTEVCHSYNLADNFQLKARYMTSLARIGYLNKKEDLSKSAPNILAVKSSVSETDHMFSVSEIAQLQNFRSRLMPNYQPLIQACGKTSEGLKFIMQLRKDCLDLAWQQRSLQNSEKFDPLASKNLLTEEEVQWVKILENDLAQSLQTWFSAGLSHIDRVTWQNSSAELLENIYKSEQVHKIINVEDFKHRLNLNNRRVFAFCHPVTGKNEPLVVLHVALTNQISDSVDALIRPTEDMKNEANNLSVNFRPDTAIFYSISSRGNQIGLNGIDLGNHMVKSAVIKLKSEIPELTTFSTLSPIPGFVKFLRTLKSSSNFWSENASYFENAESSQEKVSLILMQLSELQSHQNFKVLIQEHKNLLEKILVLYLCHCKRREFALDPVCNFHLKNGADIHRINFLADTSSKGFRESLGFIGILRFTNFDCFSGFSRLGDFLVFSESCFLWSITNIICQASTLTRLIISFKKKLLIRHILPIYLKFSRVSIDFCSSGSLPHQVHILFS